MRTEEPDTLTRLRRVRHEISREYGHDPQRLVAHYMELQDAAPVCKPGVQGSRSPKPRRPAGPAKR
jgi:hypothetical protein